MSRLSATQQVSAATRACRGVRQRFVTRSLSILAAALATLAVALPTGAVARGVTPVSDVSMSFVGDTDLGNTPMLPANPAGYLNGVRAEITNQIGFMNLEGTLTNATSSKCSPGSTECYAFRNPPSYAKIFKADGFNVVNSANNHSHDFGEQGALDTSAALKAAGIVQAGLPGQIGYRKVGAAEVAFVDFAPYTNTNDMLNYTQEANLIAQAKKKATFVVVYMHAGAEGEDADHVTGHEEYYVGENRGNAELFAKDAINDGASLVVASGPHTLRGMEFYRGHLIAYSLGDFACFGNFATVGTLDLSGILHVTLSASGTFINARFISTKLVGLGQPVLDPTHAAATFVATLSREDFGSSAAYIRANGDVVPLTK